jgi:hypothetical protein
MSAHRDGDTARDRIPARDREDGPGPDELAGLGAPWPVDPCPGELPPW